MRILIAEDDRVTARIVTGLLSSWGHEVVEASDGLAALACLQAPDGPNLAIVDWEMPGLNGPDLCRGVRSQPISDATYLILLTARARRVDVVAGLDAGADDYLTKPFDPEELRARVQAGTRIVSLQQQLRTHVTELEAALASVRQLRGLVPICSYCKAIRDDKQYWHRLETYISENSEAQFTHSICPTCYEAISADLDKG